MDQATYEQLQMQKELQQDSIDAQVAMAAPQMYEQQQQSQAVLVEQTNPKKVVRSILLRLRGMDEGEDGTEVKISEPKMNKIGIDNMWFILDSFINQNIIYSHVNDKEIAVMMTKLQEDLVDDLTLNWREYGITKKTDLDTINNSILVNIFMALKRAEGQGEKNWIKGITIENVSGASKISQPKKDSFLSKFRLG